MTLTVSLNPFIMSLQSTNQYHPNSQSYSPSKELSLQNQETTEQHKPTSFTDKIENKRIHQSRASISLGLQPLHYCQQTVIMCGTLKRCNVIFLSLYFSLFVKTKHLSLRTKMILSTIYGRESPSSWGKYEQNYKRRWCCSLGQKGNVHLRCGETDNDLKEMYHTNDTRHEQ